MRTATHDDLASPPSDLVGRGRRQATWILVIEESEPERAEATSTRAGRIQRQRREPRRGGLAVGSGDADQIERA